MRTVEARNQKTRSKIGTFLIFKGGPPIQDEVAAPLNLWFSFSSFENNGLKTAAS
jgi:hypothetical protein